MSRIHEFLKNDSEYTYPNYKHCGVNGDVEEHAVDAVVKTIADGIETVLSDVVDDVFKNIKFNKTNAAASKCTLKNSSTDNMNEDNECKCTAQHKISDAVNHPSHYQGKKFEVIDIIEDYNLGFNLGNTIKYILRAGHKDSKTQDLQKACWYLQREIDALNHDEENKQK